MLENFVHSSWSMIPFALMLLAIAIAPMKAEQFWESNLNKLIVVLILSVPTAIMLVLGGLGHELSHQMVGDYLPFIILLGALFIITGGIHLEGDILAKPWVNTLFLFIGWVLASVMGTTGAAMLLIRPLIATNSQREHKVHTVLFFIALVANCGGLLTPLGDPPLFMLFLRGAPFDWFLHLLPQWLTTGVILMLMYFVLDSYFYKHEHHTSLENDVQEYRPLRLYGKFNFVYLIGVVAAVALANGTYIPAMAAERAPIYMVYLREIILLLLTALSLLTTSKHVRFTLNKFSWMPITEVAVLFLGIFVTMTPVLVFLRAHAAMLGLTEPWQFYYATGALSSFLDNTPTAVAFHSVALGLPAEQLAALGSDTVAGIPAILLKAISLGSVMFGAMTYIGNGPNFMVKAIAERRGIKMPSFFRYMWQFSLCVLLPVYIIVQLIFL